MTEVVRNAIIDGQGNDLLVSVQPTTIDPSKNAMMVSVPDGVNISNSLVTSQYDYIVATYPTTTSEVYTFKTGGSGGTTVATVTVVYTDASKDFISTVTKT